jgi:hypothetical protein
MNRQVQHAENNMETLQFLQGSLSTRVFNSHRHAGPPEKAFRAYFGWSDCTLPKKKDQLFTV